MMSLSKYFSFKYILIIHIYREQSDKIGIGTWPSTFDSYVHGSYSKLNSTERFIMQLISNIRLSVLLINMINTYVATTVKVREISSQSKWCGLANRQQAHKNIINALNRKATFVKILLVKITDYFIRQNFAP